MDYNARLKQPLLVDQRFTIFSVGSKPNKESSFYSNTLNNSIDDKGNKIYPFEINLICARPKSNPIDESYFESLVGTTIT